MDVDSSLAAEMTMFFLVLFLRLRIACVNLLSQNITQEHFFFLFFFFCYCFGNKNGMDIVWISKAGLRGHSSESHIYIWKGIFFCKESKQLQISGLPLNILKLIYMSCVISVSSLFLCVLWKAESTKPWTSSTAQLDEKRNRRGWAEIVILQSTDLERCFSYAKNYLHFAVLQFSVI